MHMDFLLTQPSITCYATDFFWRYCGGSLQDSLLTLILQSLRLTSWQAAELALGTEAAACSGVLGALAVALLDADVLLARLLRLAARARDGGSVAVVGVDLQSISTLKWSRLGAELTPARSLETPLTLTFSMTTLRGPPLLEQFPQER